MQSIRKEGEIKINLLDIIPIQKEDLSKYKLHLAIGQKDRREPLYELSKSIKSFKLWQEWQSKKNFERDYILALIYYSKNEWIFGGIYRQKGVRKIEDHFEYVTELLDIRKELIGRAIFHFQKTGRQSYLYLEKWVEKLEVIELLRKPYTTAPFPGYENVLIDFNLLKTIIEKEEPSWKSALSSVKGVYVITDKSNGKIYVGSAYGIDSFWSRWSSYAKNGHGGNKELVNIINEKGIEYATNFQFSIIEIRSSITSDEEVQNREAFWKNVLKSREYGYNKN